jgi:hypothetical protein
MGIFVGDVGSGLVVGILKLGGRKYAALSGPRFLVPGASAVAKNPESAGMRTGVQRSFASLRMTRSVLGEVMKKNAGMRIRNGKRRGEWAELRFAVRAMEQGMRLSKPWGESAGYDFLVERETGGIVRVQVKSTMFREGGGYSCSLKNSRGPYRGNAFDFVAAYVIPEDVWYLIPRKKIRGKWSISLRPKLENAKYSLYKEAWYLVRGESRDGKGAVDRIEACAEEDDRFGAALRAAPFLRSWGVGQLVWVPGWRVRERLPAAEDAPMR